MGAIPQNMQPAKRVWLKCDKKFKREGPGNRICPNCQRLNAKYMSLGEAWIAAQRGAKRHNGETIECN